MNPGSQGSKLTNIEPRTLPASFVELFERTCRAKKKIRGRSSVGVIQGQYCQEQFELEEKKNDESQHGSSMGWVNKSQEKRV